MYNNIKYIQHKLNLEWAFYNECFFLESLASEPNRDV